MALKREDTERALQALDACCAAGDEGFKFQADKLLHIFRSDLFQALLAVSLVTFDTKASLFGRVQSTELEVVLQRASAVFSAAEGLGREAHPLAPSLPLVISTTVVILVLPSSRGSLSAAVRLRPSRLHLLQTGVPLTLLCSLFPPQPAFLLYCSLSPPPPTPLSLSLALSLTSRLPPPSSRLLPPSVRKERKSEGARGRDWQDDGASEGKAGEGKRGCDRSGMDVQTCVLGSRGKGNARLFGLSLSPRLALPVSRPPSGFSPALALLCLHDALNVFWLLSVANVCRAPPWVVLASPLPARSPAPWRRHRMPEMEHLAPCASDGRCEGEWSAGLRSRDVLCQEL
ncbi:hypothetical protein Z043_123632 [Scleropages formosus]|uniref:L27-1 domain-containing protein n=1 Tax=Scleropages formosus TaxID=113540 RepID=A0A0P7TLG4_SCLFO|nr:hypothetical protein Z043_123632 [Scleropages formosus]